MGGYESQMLRADFSPVGISYAAALRGVKPRNPGKEFFYMRLGHFDAEEMACLAASNPEGYFFALSPSVMDAIAANGFASSRKVENITFVSGSLLQFGDDKTVGAKLPEKFDYICCDETDENYDEAKMADLFSAAEKKLKKGGLFVYKYRPHENGSEALRFLVNEFAPEMSAEQLAEFMEEIKSLGGLYFDKNEEDRIVLEKAIAEKTPEIFINHVRSKGEARSKTFSVTAGLLPRGFVFAGDAEIGYNYMELSVPIEAREVLMSCKENFLYEAIKDFATFRGERSDVWCRIPVEETEDPVELFGGFTYGAARRKQNPSNSLGIDLSGGLYGKLRELMALMPLSIGDFLKHPYGKSVSPHEAVKAFHMLVASGIAEVMRSRYEGRADADIRNPKLTDGFNRYLDDEIINNGKVLLASSVIGSGFSLSAREALVLQALNRVGMEDSPSALLAELRRVSSNPALAAQIMDVSEPSAETAENMIRSVVEDSLIKWYGYGLLAA